MLSVDMRGVGERSRGGQGVVGGSPLRVFFRASPLICLVIIRTDHRGHFKVGCIQLFLASRNKCRGVRGTVLI